MDIGHEVEPAVDLAGALLGVGEGGGGIVVGAEIVERLEEGGDFVAFVGEGGLVLGADFVERGGRVRQGQHAGEAAFQLAVEVGQVRAEPGEASLELTVWGHGGSIALLTPQAAMQSGGAKGETKRRSSV